VKEEERLMPERQEVTGMIPVRLTEKRIKEGAPFETPSFWFIPPGKPPQGRLSVVLSCSFY
jgi:hypothetical protein